MIRKVSTETWGSRLLGAFFGMLFGICLLIGGIILVFWNEDHGLHVSQSLQQTGQLVHIVPNSPINLHNDLKVIYFNGLADTHTVLKDPLLGFSKNLIRLERKVQMYQWQEEQETVTEKEMGGSEKRTTTYTYKPIWSETLIDSTHFKEPTDHHNPKAMPFNSRRLQAEHVTVGDFNLPATLIDDISKQHTVDLSTFSGEKLKMHTPLPMRHDDKQLYFGKDEQAPQIGDIQVKLIAVHPQIVSVLAQQTDHTVQAFIAPAGQPVALLVSGNYSPTAMILGAESQNRTMMWVWRGVSLIMMIIGIALLGRPLVVFADVLPILGNVVSAGIGFLAFVGGFLLWGLMTAIAWFAVRPLWAVGLLVLVCVCCYWLVSRRGENS